MTSCFHLLITKFRKTVQPSVRKRKHVLLSLSASIENRKHLLLVLQSSRKFAQTWQKELRFHHRSQYSSFPHLSSTMEAKCVNPYSKRQFRLTEEGFVKSERYGLRKRMKALDGLSMKNGKIIEPVRTTVTQYQCVSTSFNKIKQILRL